MLIMTDDYLFSTIFIMIDYLYSNFYTFVLFLLFYGIFTTSDALFRDHRDQNPTCWPKEIA